MVSSKCARHSTRRAAVSEVDGSEALASSRFKVLLLNSR